MILNTARVPFFSLREAVTEDDVAISVFKYSNFPAVGANPEKGQNGAIDLNSPHLMDVNSPCIACWGAGGNDKVITGYKLLGVARQNGPIFTLLAGAMISGSLACTVHPLTGDALSSNFWVDTITVTGGLLQGRQTLLDVDNNRICMLKFDKKFIAKVFLEYDEDSSGMTTFSAMIGGY